MKIFFCASDLSFTGLSKASNEGIVMVNFYNARINCPPRKQPKATIAQVAGKSGFKVLVIRAQGIGEVSLSRT